MIDKTIFTIPFRGCFKEAERDGKRKEEPNPYPTEP